MPIPMATHRGVHVQQLHNEPSSTDVADRVAVVRRRIQEAAVAAGRHPADVRLLAVSKTHPPQHAAAAVAAGVVDLGENRVQELIAKQPLVEGARWHLIGSLQRNKVRDVVGRQVLVHSVDRRSLAAALSSRAERAGTIQRVLVQVNVGDDPAKGGCSLAEVDELVAYARDLPNLAVEGLMTIPPLPPAGVDPATSARSHFAALRGARDELRVRYPEVVHLSMGMSADLEAAVAEGATMVRLGTAIFGPRGDAPWRKDEL
jgi:PLP dependent protein